MAKLIRKYTPSPLSSSGEWGSIPCIFLTVVLQWWCWGLDKVGITHMQMLMF